MKIICTNKNANRNYEIIETLEVGISLSGCEVKSISRANCSINESYITFSNNEANIINMHVANFFEGNMHNLDPYRTRKLLMHKKEIIKWSFNTKKDRLTCIPLKLYWRNNKIKVEIALAKGKKLHDKREDMKQKDMQREMKKCYF